MKKGVEVLISCMHQKDNSILGRSNLNHDVLIVNQCDTREEKVITFANNVKRIDTPKRGLSVSRNMALNNAQGEICIISDDDEYFENNIQETVEKEYEKYPNADLLILAMRNWPSKLKQRPHKLSFLELLRVSSWQITFKLSSIREKGIQFDEKLGSGTGNGGGEEIKFLCDCHRAGLQIYYTPVYIASVGQKESQWFFGYDDSFFYDRGMTTRYTFGLIFSVLYAVYYAISHRKMFEKDIAPIHAIRKMMQGIFENKLSD